MKVAVTGGTGFIGSHLVDYLTREQVEVLIISRSCPEGRTPQGVKCLTWDEIDKSVEQLEGIDAIVNLAGESIDQRWTEAAKQRVLQSRLDVTGRVGRIVEQLEVKPKAVINGSGMSFYGTSLTDTYDESSPHRSTDFLAGVVKEWEEAADQIQGPRIVKLRTGLVLGKDEGALPKMVLPYKLGVGGRVGSGKQWVSWIHIQDMVRLIKYCIDHEEISGPVNCTAPVPVTNDQFGRSIGKVLNRPHYFPVPAFVLKLMFGEMSVLLLEGQRVIPQVLLDHGYVFSYPTVQEALSDIYNK
jgi:uncharacterized protein (TIGR01777 family)